MKPPGDLLRLDYLPVSRLSQQAGDGAPGVLGGVCFFHPAIPVEAAGLPLLSVDMALLEGEEALCEVWYSQEVLESGCHHGIRYRQGETLLFGWLTRNEAAEVTPLGVPLQTAAQAAYESVFELLESRGYKAILRFWNYFPGVNRVTHNLERYLQFNIGRQNAFLSHGRSVIGNVPAACALGSAGGGLQVAFLAARADPVGIENPRQTSAYHYPDQYGPRSPTFSRASLVHLWGRDLLFISGTASIVGHQTLHAGDVGAQTRECLHNIAAVVAEANRRVPGAGFQLGDLVYKVYIRYRDDLVSVRRELIRFIGVPVSAVFLQADVCRADLLVEIEASGGHALPLPRRPGAGP
jgi:chorismate lyase / 3-hydroxybenzoate synthase